MALSADGRLYLSDGRDHADIERLRGHYAEGDSLFRERVEQQLMAIDPRSAPGAIAALRDARPVAMFNHRTARGRARRS